MSESTTFDPGRYLTKVGGSDYLEVKWRLVWLREVHPEAVIETELVSHSDQMAIFRARVTIPDGGSATGYGSEDYNDFRDYIEKSETKAIGRACAALGFGTQFCPDFDFGGVHGAFVDSPVDRQNRPGRTAPPQNGQRPTVQNPAAPASPPQLNFIRGLAKECGYVIQGPDGTDHLDDVGFSAYVGAAFQSDWPNVTKGTASALIEQLQSERDERRARPDTQAAMMRTTDRNPA